MIENTQAQSVRKPRFTSAHVFGFVIVLVAIATGYATYSIRQPSAPDMSGFFWPNPKTISAFEFNATEGSDLDLGRLQGKWTFLFFGYTFCPDVCPTTLSTMTQVVERLRAEREAEDVQVVFVSVDPERDTLDRMAKYVSYFDETFIGATAPPEQLDVLTRQLGVLHFSDPPDDAGNYHVNHSASIILVDPKLRYVGLFGTPHSSEKIASQFLEIKNFVESQS